LKSKSITPIKVENNRRLYVIIELHPIHITLQSNSRSHLIVFSLCMK